MNADKLADALRKLIFAAQTSGGVSGRDDELCRAIGNASIALDEYDAHPQANKTFIVNMDQAAAWRAVADALTEVAPGWLRGDGTGMECAVATIKRLAQPAQAAQPIQDMLDAGDPDWRKKLRPNLTGDEAMRFAVRDIAEERRMLADEVTILRAAQPVGVPDGWVMVPRAPDEAMLAAIDELRPPSGSPEQITSTDFRSRWRDRHRRAAKETYVAMLAAAQPPAQPSADTEDAALWRFVISEKSRGEIDYAVIRVDWSKCDGNLPRFMEPQDVPEIKAAMAQDSDAARAAEGDGK